MKKEMHYDINPAVALNTQAISSDTTTNGNWIDTQGYQSLEFVFQAGVLTDGDYTPLIMEADATDKSDAAAVADADLVGTEAAAQLDTSNTLSKIGYIGKKRYVRFSVVSANTSGGGTVGATSVLGRPGIAPVS